MAERAISIEDTAGIRFRGGQGAIGGFVRLPYEVLAGRTIAAEMGKSFDVTVSAADFLSWVDAGGPVPDRRDAHWLSPLPPKAGWQRVEEVPDVAIREVIRSGSVLAQDVGTTKDQASLLSAIVLTASNAERAVEVPLGPLSGLTRMGFLPHQSHAAIDVVAGWLRVTALYGSTFVNSGGSALGILNLGF
jgi:hypothetical protein